MEHLPPNEGYPAQKKNTITLDHFEFLKILGLGGYGKVTLCKYISTQELVAMKIFKKEVILTKRNMLMNTQMEHTVLKVTSHPFLTSLKYSFQTKQHVCFAMEYAGGGDLFYHLARENAFDENKARFYAAEITLALGYLHAEGIIHRDLKAENILLDLEGHVKIADFGFARTNIGYGMTTRGFAGTVQYMAPEVVLDTDYGRAVDWWGLGVIMYRMMYGKLPFQDSNLNSLCYKIAFTELKYSDSLSCEAINFLDCLLTKEPHERLGGCSADAKEVMKHPFFWDVDWFKMSHKRIAPPFQPELSNTLDTRYFDNYASVSLDLSEVGENQSDDYDFTDFNFQDSALVD